jgi:plasmid maintenance system antidote protein VapI
VKISRDPCCIHRRAETTGIEPKTLAKMVKTLHKITAKMAKTLGLYQNDENQFKNSPKTTW